MLEGKAVIGETDMLQTMQQDALDLASKALDFYDVTEAIDIARFIKKVIKKNKEDYFFGYFYVIFLWTNFLCVVNYCRNLIGCMDLVGNAL